MCSYEICKHIKIWLCKQILKCEKICMFCQLLDRFVKDFYSEGFLISMKGRGQIISKIILAYIHSKICFLINKRNTTFFCKTSKLVWGSLFLYFLHFWDLNVLKIFIFLRKLLYKTKLIKRWDFTHDKVGIAYSNSIS